MKTKHFLCLALIVLLTPASRVWGSMVMTLVDATNIQQMPFMVRTDTSGNAQYEGGMNFYVIADPKGPGDSGQWQLNGASLTVYDGANFGLAHMISSCEVPGESVPGFMQDVKPPLVKNGVFYSIEVSTNHLDDVDFEISYEFKNMPALNCYRFALRTFLPEGTTNRTFPAEIHSP